jgi:hypothetical protein
LKHQIFEVCRIFVFVFIIVQAHKFAKESGEKNGRARALRGCAVWCFGIALAFAALKGQPSCEDRDAYSCNQYADDGYTPTGKEREETFAFWSLLLATPAAFGVFESRRYAKNPWSKPEQGNTDAGNTF